MRQEEVVVDLKVSEESAALHVTVSGSTYKALKKRVQGHEWDMPVVIVQVLTKYYTWTPKQAMDAAEVFFETNKEWFADIPVRQTPE
jgi:hypothetical protein